MAITLLMTSLVANGLGLGVGSVFSNAQRAAAMLPVVILPFMLFGGIYSNLGTMPKWISWLQYLSVFKYNFEALM